MGGLSRLKGRAFEQAVAKRLRPVFGDRVKRGYQTRNGREACDVDGTPWWIECKHGRQVNVRAAMAQALQATDGRPVLVVAKDNGVREPFVCMLLKDWLELAQRELSSAVVEALRGVGDGPSEEEVATDDNDQQG